MKFKSPVYATASGSIAGVTYSRNRSGLFTRARTYPVNPRTFRQQAERIMFATLMEVWSRELTPTQRRAWNTWAENTPFIDELGKPYKTSGRSAYFRLNATRLRMDLARWDDGPTIFSNPGPCTSIQTIGSGDVGAIGINLAGTHASWYCNRPIAAEASGDVVFYIGRPINPTRTFPKGPYQYSYFRPAFKTTVQINMTWLLSDMQQDNGPLVIGQHRNVQIRISVDDGRLSVPYSIVARIVADTV